MKRRSTDTATDLVGRQNLYNKGAFLQIWTKLLGPSDQQKMKESRVDPTWSQRKRRLLGVKSQAG